MARRYVCTICGRSVASFASWKDVEPSEIVGLLEAELEGHNVNTSDMDPAHVLGRFRIEDEDERTAFSPVEEDDADRWVGQ